MHLELSRIYILRISERKEQTMTSQVKGWEQLLMESWLFYKLLFANYKLLKLFEITHDKVTKEYNIESSNFKKI